MPVQYPNAIPRTIADKAGDFPSVLDFGLSDGVHDVSTVLNNAVASVDGQTRGFLYLPGGTYVLDGTSPWLFPSSLTGGITVFGDPGKTIVQVKSGSSFSTGSGVVDISCSNVTFRDIIFDGAVTTPTNVLYSAITAPTQTSLISNSMFWIHGQSAGSSNFTFDGVTVQHTGGYAIAGDATGGECSNLSVLNSTFQNNRPFLFGSDGTVWGGAWTGGIFLFGDGTAKMWHTVLMQGCFFQCNTGNAFWQWAPALSYLHTNVSAIGNNFVDNGLDCIEMGAVNGGTVSHNTFRRVGYISSSDFAVGSPVWVTNAYGSAIDTSGLCINLNYSNNSGVSINGSCINTDGFGSGTITGNTFRQPSSSDPEYTVDQIASSGPETAIGQNWVQGIVQSNTSDTEQGDQNVTISGNTFINMGGGAINLFGTRNSIAVGNNIQHPANAQVVPVTIGNIGSGSYQRATGNVVTQNVISWSPGSAAPMVAEIPNGTAFTTAQVNQVYGNICTPGMPEFQPDANSGSSVGGQPSGTAQVYSSNYGGTSAVSAHAVQREGRNSDFTAALRVYGTEGTTSTLQMQLQSYSIGGTSPVYQPLLNISANGVAGTGVYATGNRTTVAQDSTKTYTLTDSMVTGNLYADCQLILTDTTYSDNQANILNEVVGGGSTGTAVYAALRYKGSVGHFEQSTTVSSGSRVWTAFGGGGGGSVAGSDKQVQYNNSGSFAADANLEWDYTNQVLTVAGKTGTAGIVASTCYVQSAQGFYTTSTSFQGIQAPSGGLYGKSASLADYLGIASVAIGSLAPTSGDNWYSGSVPTGVLSFDHSSGTPFFYISAGTASSTIADAYVHAAGYAATSTSYQAIQCLSGGVNTNSASLAGYLGLASLGSAPTPTSGDSWASGTGVLYFGSGNWYFKVGSGASTLGDTAILNASGFNASGTASNAIQAASGGVTAAWLVATDSWFLQAESAPSLSSSGQARIYFDSTSHLLMASLNGGAYTALSTGTTPPGGSNQQVQYNSSGSFAGSGNFTWNNSSQLLTVTASSSSSAGIAVGTGYVQSDAGLYVTSGAAASYQNVNVPTGGVYANSFRAIVYTQVGKSSGAPTMTTGDAVQAGCLYWDTGSSYSKIYDGSAWHPVNLAAGTGISISGNTISCTVSGTSPGGSNTDVQYNSSGSFAGSGNFVWNNSSQLLTVTAANSSSAGVVCGTGYIQADAGFYATSATATSYQAIQAPGGGMYANSTRSIVYTQLGTNSGAPTMTSGDSLQKGCVYWDTSDSYALIYNGSGWLPLNLSAGTGISLSGNTVSTNLTAGTGISISGATISTNLTAGSGISISGATISCTVSGASPGGSSTDVQYNSSGSFAGSGNFTWNNSTQLLTVTAPNSSSSGIVCGTGYIQADAGFYATTGTATSYQAIQAPGGGMYGRSHRSIYYTQIGTSFGAINSGGSAAALTSGDSLQDGCLFWDTSAGYARIYNGSTWLPVNLSASTGISISGNSISVSLTAGTGVSISGATISIGQAVSTSSSVTFGSVTTTGTIQSSASGTSIAFQTGSPFNFQVNGNGVVSCQQVNVAGSTVINSSKQFVGAGVACQSNGIGGGGFNVWNGSSYTSGASGTITLASTTTITVSGGVITGWS